ncbi:MAG TPA: polyprenyl synthetase family protein [Polyangiaceae bacterium]|jgi:octaprenyl-diphosphate synthase|nr:polyprenyl synthetase family protein [Polyangiaceae bacterium]
MTLPIQAAIASLSRAAEGDVDHAKLERRLDGLQALLADDLAWVEVALSEATGRGERPARDAARHLVLRGGKRVRPTALLLSTACFGPVPQAARELALVAELIHSATLLHDDVIDDGTERRGAPTSRTLWGNAVSVLAGDLLLVEALDRTGRSAPAVLPTLFSTLRQLVDGEVVQLRGRRELDASRDTYERVLRGKTASLFRFATSVGARLGGASEADQERLGLFGELVGMAFQLVDDALDYDDESTKKTALSDLRDGKMTLPLVLTVEKHPELLTAVRLIHRGDDAPLADVRRAVLEGGACDEVRKLAAAKTERALEVLRSVPRSDARTLLEEVVDGLASRNA